MDTWYEAFKHRDDLLKYKSNAIGLFALELKFNIDDIDSVASDAITDGSNDKKCDIIYIDLEERYAVIAQCYFSENTKKGAKSNKASDLNTAIGWLFSQNIEVIPLQIKSHVITLRDAIKNNKIDNLYIWYIHNRRESKNVKEELDTVYLSTKTILEENLGNRNFKIKCQEIGNNTLEEWYTNSRTPIIVQETITFDNIVGFEEKTEQWKSLVTSIKLSQLKKLFTKFGSNLFSANIRDYLGIVKKDENINYNIQKTASQDPENFWIYNNGMTILTSNYEYNPSENLLTANGISIINGAQTTGSIGNISNPLSDDSKILVRFVRTDDKDILFNIVKYNNSQNKISAADFRSTDEVQRRLCEEMNGIPSASYAGGRRGGDKDAIQRNSNLLPSYTVGQSLYAFHVDPILAYNSKSKIWQSDKMYSDIFNEKTTAKHIIFVFSLLKCIEELQYKSKKETEDTSTNIKVRELLSIRGISYLITNMIADCMEDIIKKKIPDLFSLSFGSISPKNAISVWNPLISMIIHIAINHSSNINDRIKSEEALKFKSTVKSLIASVLTYDDPKPIKDFRKKVLME